ncbi:unnamed protein product [Haemonchus placei]|uniref:Uncharacterized protein n=1 Tax=Haemonchus placei TaxID=6290 RepID=A0A0N4VXA3_HAEPC|nr:unnamed protein product [Haemonchus placei]
MRIEEFHSHLHIHFFQLFPNLNGFLENYRIKGLYSKSDMSSREHGRAI